MTWTTSGADDLALARSDVSLARSVTEADQRRVNEGQDGVASLVVDERGRTT